MVRARHPMRSATAAACALAALLAIAGCGRQPLDPSSGLAAASAAREARRASQGAVENEVVVTLAPGVDAAAFANEVGAVLLDVEVGDCVTLAAIAPETTAELAARLALDARVVTSEVNEAFEPAETRQKSWGFDDGLGSPQTYQGQPMAAALHLVEAHHVSAGNGVLVAILDTGADLSHPELAGRVVGGWDFVDGDADPSESLNGLDDDADGFTDEAYGHGTHVAGIVLLTAPASRLLVVRVLDSDGRGDMQTIAAGIQWARAHGARVINLSLGGLRNSDAVQHALEAAEYANVVCVASAGNWGGETPTEFPARSSHALAVAALDSYDRAATFSSYGDFVALSAPGIAIRSTFPGGGYALWSGTSMSAPFVSGGAALLLSVHPTWGSLQVLQRLGTTARSLSAMNPGIADKLGDGALDLGAALWPDYRTRPDLTGGGGKGGPRDVQ